jgi:hypothetical protein
LILNERMQRTRLLTERKAIDLMSVASAMCR